MPMRISDPIRLHVWGEGACFTRPEMKVERVSYEVMTPAAARGVLEAILWKPEMRWRVTAIDVLKPIRFAQLRRNEVGKKATPASRIVIEEDRQQRAMLHLVDVAYVIHAAIELTHKAGPQDSIAKYHQSFLRRAGAGQCHSRPYLGTREFAAHFALLGEGEAFPPLLSDARDLGFMFYDFDYRRDQRAPRFFPARLEGGRLVVPPGDSLDIRA